MYLDKSLKIVFDDQYNICTVKIALNSNNNKLTF